MHTNVHATPKDFEEEDKIKPKLNIFSAWSPKCPDRDKLQGPVFFSRLNDYKTSVYSYIFRSIFIIIEITFQKRFKNLNRITRIFNQ